MSRFSIECPECHRFVEAKTGFFARKKIDCICGREIKIRTDKMTSRTCTSCGNIVVYDQSKGIEAKCPVCHEQLISKDSLNNMIAFQCITCGCELHANKRDPELKCPICDTMNDVQKQLKLAQQKAKGLPTIISYEGDNKTFAWKHPITDFVTGSQLIVHESQEAIFFRNGEALDSFSIPGRYTLETGVLPKMDALYHLPVNGEPFHAEVYFVNLTTQMGIKWGTNSKVGLFDPISGIHVELGASGSFNLQVTDARRLIIRLVGTTTLLDQSQVFTGETGYFRTLVMTKVKSTLARIIKENHINVLEIDEHLDLISSSLKEAINLDLAEYGLFAPEFYVANIVTPDDDPNFRRMKQQHADQYLRVREEQIRKSEAEAAFERKSVEAQTAARMKVIGAQGDAEAIRIKAAAEAEAYRLQAKAEAQEMRMKGYTYQQETARQVGIEAMRNAGVGEMSALASDMMQLGVGMGAIGSVIGMAKDAISPIASTVSESFSQQVSNGQATNDCWNCSCGEKNISSKFCPECGQPRPQVSKKWNCSCGTNDISSNFCPNCGKKRPDNPIAWDCPSCNTKGIISLFCPECGHKKGV